MDSIPIVRKTQKICVHMLWVEGTLSQLELISVKSFLCHNFDVTLWHFGDIPNVPSGVTLRHVEELLPSAQPFTYANGSYAAFSNLFRYTVLNRFGGLWSDTDVICLRDETTLSQSPFLVSERVRNAQSIKININLIYSPTPERGDIIDLARVFSEAFDVPKLRWGDCGPKLMTLLVKNYPQLAWKVYPPEFCNAIDWWDCPRRLLEPAYSLPEGAAFIHCYNEMWRRAGVDKNRQFPQDSLMAVLADRYL